MSTIVSLATPDSIANPTIISGENLEIIGQQGEKNIVEIKLDSPITFMGGTMDDTITAGAGDATIVAGDGNDTIVGRIGDDILIGGEGNDTIEGGAGADSIFGDAGNDVLRSGTSGMGSDTIKGGDGADVFEFDAFEFSSGAVDEIVDFKADDFADAIKILGVGEGTVSYDENTGMVSINGKEVIDIGEGQGDLTIEKQDDTWEIF